MILVFASGQGSNFDAIMHAFPNKVVGLVCNKEDALVLKKAKDANISCYLIPHAQFSNKETGRMEHEKAILDKISHLNNIKIIVLAGYMRVLSPYFLTKIQQTHPNLNIINLHPAYLDEYKGAHAYEYVVQHKFSRSGLSVHKVTEDLDAGPLLGSLDFSVLPYESPAELQNRVRPLEHSLLIQVISNLLSQESL